MPQPPEPAPASVRWVPPRVPPAPPGAGPCGPSGSSGQPRRLSPGLDALLRAWVSSAQIAATHLESLEAVPEDSEQARQVRWLIKDGRRSLDLALRDLRLLIEPGSRRLSYTDLHRFKQEWLRLCVYGSFRAELDRELKTGVFTAVAELDVSGWPCIPDQLYRYPLPPHHSEASLGLLPAGRVVQIILDDLRSVLADDKSFGSAHAFETEVVQRLLALVHAAKPAGLLPVHRSGSAEPPRGVRVRDLIGSPHREPPARDDDPEERRIRHWERPSD